MIFATVEAELSGYPRDADKASANKAVAYRESFSKQKSSKGVLPKPPTIYKVEDGAS